jgi:hypothetical protein
MGMRANRRDANEAEIVEFWRRMGCVWIPMKPGQGFDGLLIDRRGIIRIVEIKNFALGWSITPAEEKLSNEIEARGAKYYIVESLKAAATLIGLDVD